MCRKRACRKHSPCCRGLQAYSILCSIQYSMLYIVLQLSMLAVEKAWRKGNSRREKTMQDRRCIRSRDQRNGILAPVPSTESRRLWSPSPFLQEWDWHCQFPLRRLFCLNKDKRQKRSRQTQIDAYNKGTQNREDSQEDGLSDWIRRNVRRPMRGSKTDRQTDRQRRRRNGIIIAKRAVIDWFVALGFEISIWKTPGQTYTL